MTRAALWLVGIRCQGAAMMTRAALWLDRRTPISNGWLVGVCCLLVHENAPRDWQPLRGLLLIVGLGLMVRIIVAPCRRRRTVRS